MRPKKYRKHSVSEVVSGIHNKGTIVFNINIKKF